MTEKKLENTSIHYWINDTEVGSAIIFIHPAFANHTCFDTQLDYFRDYKVITIDLIGHGKSIGKGSIEDTALYINQIMEIEKIDKINLVGVSIGAVLVQDFANKYQTQKRDYPLLIGVGEYDNDMAKKHQLCGMNQNRIVNM